MLAHYLSIRGICQCVFITAAAAASCCSVMKQRTHAIIPYHSFLGGHCLNALLYAELIIATLCSSLNTRIIIRTTHT